MGRGGRHKPPAQRRRRPASRRRGYAAIGTGLAVIGGGVAAVSLMPHHSSAQALASDCGTVTCTAALPSPAVASISASASPSPHRTRPPRPRHTAKPHTHPAAKPKPVLASPAAPATQPAAPPPTVTVTYTLVQKWNGGFQGRFVITNNGGSWLNGWRLVATLPGDQVTSASGAAYQTDGDTVTFDQALLQSGIAPGSSLTLTFDAQGTTTSPSGCSLNGSGCAA